MDFFRNCLAINFKTKKKNKKKQLINQNEKEYSHDHPQISLYDDVLFLIILRLPLKHAIQCKTLNKNIYHYISQSNLAHRHALLSSLHINNTILHKPSVLLRHLVPRTHDLDDRNGEITVLASSDGLLLFSIEWFTLPYHACRYYVCNLITGEIIAVHQCMQKPYGSTYPVGLVVDLGDADKKTSDHHPFKIVTSIKIRDTLRFQVIVPAGPLTRIKSRVDFPCGMLHFNNGTTLHDADHQNHTRPVYLNGALHWLGGDLSKILVFDLEKEQAKIISGPMNGYIYKWYMNMWFGSVMGSLSLVSTSWDVEITIHVHDYANDAWRIQHKIANYIAHPAIADRYCTDFVVPLFFDGENLFVQLINGRNEAQLFVHEISSKRWEYLKKPVGRFWGPRFFRPFIPFLPTLAKVSDSDHDDDHLDQKIIHNGLKFKGAHSYDIEVISSYINRLRQKFIRVLD